MTVTLAQTFIPVHDPDEALGFYRDALGLEVRLDVASDGFRWVTVGAPGQDVAITLMLIPGPPVFDAETQAQMKELLAKGALTGLFFAAEDIRETYEELKSRGVEFGQ